MRPPRLPNCSIYVFKCWTNENWPLNHYRPADVVNTMCILLLICRWCKFSYKKNSLLMYCGFYSKDEMKTIFQFGSYNKASCSTSYIVCIKILSGGECLAPQPFRTTLCIYIIDYTFFNKHSSSRHTLDTLPRYIILNLTKSIRLHIIPYTL